MTIRSNRVQSFRPKSLNFLTLKQLYNLEIVRLGEKVFEMVWLRGNIKNDEIVMYKKKQIKVVLLGGKPFKIVWLGGKTEINGLARRKKQMKMVWLAEK